MSVENVVPLPSSEVVQEEEVQASEDVGEASKGDANQVEMDLKKTILMVEDKENVIPATP